MASSSLPAMSGIGGSSAHLSPAPPPPTGPQHCALLGPLSLLVQSLMLLLVLSSLLVKRAVEHPKRPWRIFALDASKQFIGQGFVHAANLLISSVPASAPPRHGQVAAAVAAVEAAGSSLIVAAAPLEPTPPEGVNPCSLYFLNVLIDCTLGVLIIWAVLRTAKYILVTRLGLEGWVTGVYRSPAVGSKVRVGWWAKQCALYVASLVLMKATVIVIFALLPVIFDFGSWILDWLDPHAQVVFVMALFPLAMNCLQFFLIDNLLKHSASSSLLESPGHSPRPGAYAALPTHTSPAGSPSMTGSQTLQREASYTVLASARSRAASAAGSPTSPAHPGLPQPHPIKRVNSASGREGEAWAREWESTLSPGVRPVDNDDEEKLADEERGLGLNVGGVPRASGS